MSQIQEAESVSRTSSASFFSQEEIDHVLRLGSNAIFPRVSILFAYQYHLPASQLMTVLKNEYVGGSGFKSANGDFSAWYAGDGIHLSRGHSARFSQTAQVIPWLDVAERIGELLQTGQFVPDDEFPKADVTVRTKLAEAIVRVNGALTENAVESGLLPSLRREKHLIFPVEIAEVSRQLADLDFVDRLYSEFRALCETYRQDKSIFTYLPDGPDKVMDSLTAFTRAVRDYPTGLYNVPEVERFITDDEIDHLLGSGNPNNNRATEIHTFFTGDHTAKEKADFLKKTLGIGGSSNLYGPNVDYRSGGITFTKPGCDKVTLSLSKAAARVNALIVSERYFVPEKKPQRDTENDNPALDIAKRLINEYCQRKFGDDADYSDLSRVGLAYTTTEEGELEVQVSADLVNYRMLYEVEGELVARVQFHDLDELNEFFEDLDFSELVAFAEEHREKEQTVSVPAAYNTYNDIKEHRPDSIVLFQMGDFFEMYGEDARTAAEMLDLAITTRPVAGIGRLTLCGVPSHRLNDYVELLRDKYDVTVAALGDNGERQITTRLSFDHEAERAIDAQEAVYGADAFGSRTLGTTPDLPEPYLPLRDKATQEDIDTAIQRWNGSIESKHAVVRYMERHGREKDTAAWLSREYGGAPALPLHVTLTGTGEEATLPWPKAQRRIAHLIQQDRFYTDEEQDRFDNIDPIAIREALAQPGIVNGEVVDPDALANNPFIRQVREDVERITRDEAEQSDQPTPTGAPDGPGNRGREDMAGDASESVDAPEQEQMSQVGEAETPNGPGYTTETVAVYPAEETQLPYEVVVERLHFDEPERTPPTPTPTNFRITDDHLGEGGAKTKFKRNMAAITLLKELSDVEKETAFREYIEGMDESERAAAYIQIMCIPAEEQLNASVSQVMASMTRADMESSLAQGLTEQMGMDEASVQDYVSGMSDEELTGLYTQMVTEQVKTQYAAQVQQQMSGMEASQLSVALDLAMPGYTTEQCALFYDEITEFSDSTYEDNLSELGCVDLESPASISIFASTFENKDVIEDAISAYNEDVDELSQIHYTDYVGIMMSSVTTIINAITYVLIAFVAISLIVSSIMIGVITLISVQERTKEIGILRAIGASKRNVSSMFNAETVIIGFTSGTLGVLITYLLCIPINLLLHHLTGIGNLSAFLPLPAALILIAISMVLTLIAGIIPSRSAAKKDPVVALRTE